jgi:2-C-methyl-D-erythritol 2,4-cyclodiphosphate synthase
MVPGRAVNADATVICESPRIEPQRAQMERELAAVLSAKVSVKATSNEGMGWIGRNEGIACIAVVLVDLAAADFAAATVGPGRE